MAATATHLVAYRDNFLQVLNVGIFELLSLKEMLDILHPQS